MNLIDFIVIYIYIFDGTMPLGAGQPVWVPRPAPWPLDGMDSNLDMTQKRRTK